MGFKEVQDLSADVTIALGGFNKQTKKPNPVKIEGYYLGTRQVKSPKSKSGLASIHIFQTAKGNVGVWGKTDLDRKMSAAQVGAMTRVTQNGMVPTPNGEMYKYKVEIDGDNTIEVDTANFDTGASEETEGTAPGETESFGSDTAEDYGASEEEETGLDEDESPADEIQPQRAAAPKRAPTAPDAARQAKVKALLNRSKATA